MLTALRLGHRPQHILRQQTRCLAVDPEAPKRKQQKANKKKKKSSAGGAEQDSMANKNMKMVMAALDAPRKQEPSITDAEERERRQQIGRNHVMGRFRQHNEIDHDLTCKIYMKQHAVKMLPRDSPIRDAALAVNTIMPPPWRPIPVWTPPMAGFDPSQFVERVEEED